jgi:hypothetical protein
MHRIGTMSADTFIVHVAGHEQVAGVAVPLEERVLAEGQPGYDRSLAGVRRE